ncbi:MAG: hypothetical protein AAB424_02760 [Patescibacteria group bacterium]
MLQPLLITIAFTCTTPELAGTQLNTTHGSAATRQLEQISRSDSTAWTTLGTLFANRIFMMESTNKRQDADSALFYFRKAQAVCPNNPVIAAYIAVATGLRAKEDGFWRKITGKTENQALGAFALMDTIRQQNPKNLAVQFLSACLFRDAPKQFDSARAYHQKSYDTFHALHSIALSGTVRQFFTPDVHGHILLSLANLVGKLEASQDADMLSCQYITQLLAHFPNSPAAEYARDKKLQCE